MDDVECFKCNNFGNKASECRIRFEYSYKSHNAWKPAFPKDKKNWKCKSGKNMECGLALSSHDQEKNGTWIVVVPSI